MASRLPDEMIHLKCQEQIEKDLGKYVQNPNWQRNVDPQLNVKSYSAPSDQFGRWVEIQTFKDTYLHIFELSKTHTFQYSHKNCKYIYNSDMPALDFLKKKTQNTFTDDEFEKIVNKNEFSLIYAWSPTMIYSMSEMHIFQQACKKLGLKFIPVLDYTQSIEDAKNQLSKYKKDIAIRHYKSIELEMRGGLTHFPVSYVVGKKIISQKIFGAFTSDLLDREMKKRIDLINLRSTK